MILEIFTDGGLLSRNPSLIGGTWAWCGVDKDGERIAMEWGVVPAPDGYPITNNHMEQIAITKALEAMPDGWNGTLCSDSKIALGRVFKGWRETNLPANISKRSYEAAKRMGSIRTVLVQGHPTKADLKKGIGKKRDLPVSIHNVWCDKACNLAREDWFNERLEAEADKYDKEFKNLIKEF